MAQSNRGESPGREHETPIAPPTTTTTTTTEPSTQPGGALDAYHTATDTVGLLPSLRLSDNLIQLVVVVGCTAIAFLVALLFVETLYAAFIAAAAMIVSAFISGFVLMILGWVRTAKKARKSK